METFDDVLKPSGRPDGAKVERLFHRIASRYDITNRFLTLGIDLWWRSQLVSAVQHCYPQTVVDLATGSGDVAFALRRRLGKAVTITGIDFCQSLLDCAIQRKGKRADYESIQFTWGDCLDLPLSNESADAITIAFGFRNLADRNKGLQEILRVLRKPHGRLLILEFTQPVAWLRPLYYAYLHYGLPAIAGVITGAPSAYRYLTSSIKNFPDKQSLANEIKSAGFVSVDIKSFSGGLVALHTATVSET